MQANLEPKTDGNKHNKQKQKTQQDNIVKAPVGAMCRGVGTATKPWSKIESVGEMFQNHRRTTNSPRPEPHWREERYPAAANTGRK